MKFSSIAAWFTTCIFLLVAGDGEVSAAEVPARCRATNGIYKEPFRNEAALFTPSQVELSFRYDLLPDKKAASTAGVTALASTKPIDDVVIKTLQQRFTDAMVFTLFDSCRVDPKDKMKEVNLQSVVVDVISHKDLGYYSVQVQVVGDTGTGEQEQALAQMRLENAVRIVVNSHHLTRVALSEGGYTLALKEIPGSSTTNTPPKDRTPKVYAPPENGGDTIMHGARSTAAWQPGCYTIVAAGVVTGIAALVLFLHFIPQTRGPHDLDKEMAQDELDDVELACACKPTDKLVHPEVLDDTEVSESSTSYEEEDW
jgi:hypothetical protein